MCPGHARLRSTKETTIASFLQQKKKWPRLTLICAAEIPPIFWIKIYLFETHAMFPQIWQLTQLHRLHSFCTL